MSWVCVRSATPKDWETLRFKAEAFNIRHALMLPYEDQDDLIMQLSMRFLIPSYQFNLWRQIVKRALGTGCTGIVGGMVGYDQR